MSAEIAATPNVRFVSTKNEPPQSAWKTGELPKMFGLFTAAVIGAGIVLVAFAQIIVALA